MNKLSSLFTYCAALLFLAGCAQQHETVNQICLADTNKDVAMRAAEDVLGLLNFSIDKSDPQLGIIRTRPLAAAQFFEFWRADNVGSFNSTEANLHSIRRIAELDLTQQGSQLCIGCTVNTQRLRLPEREIRSHARAYGLISQGGPSRQLIKMNQEQKQAMAWIDLGNDPELATVILKNIENKLSKIKGTSL